MMKLTLQEIELFVQDVQQESVKPGYVQWMFLFWVCSSVVPYAAMCNFSFDVT